MKKRKKEAKAPKVSTLKPQGDTYKVLLDQVSSSGYWEANLTDYLL
jgi:hypothetical protein